MSSDPEWKYVNVRRLFIYLEHSIDKSTQWAVFEPNNERLWAQHPADHRGLPARRLADRRADGHQARGGVLRPLRPHHDDPERPRQRPADLPDRRRPDLPGRVRDLPDRPVDRRRAAASLRPDRRKSWHQRDNPYGAFNFMVALGDDRRRGPDRRRLLRRQRPRQRGQVLRVPQRQRQGEPRPQDRQHQQHRRRHAQARRDRRPAAVRTGSRRPATATFDPQTVTITLLDEARTPVCSWMLQQRPAEEVGRPDARRQGRRRGGDGGAAPGRRADRLRGQLSAMTTGLRLGAPGVYPARRPATTRPCGRSRWTTPASPGWRRGARWTCPSPCAAGRSTWRGSASGRACCRWRSRRSSRREAGGRTCSGSGRRRPSTRTR